jgi:hypothetical protein
VPWHEPGLPLVQASNAQRKSVDALQHSGTGALVRALHVLPALAPRLPQSGSATPVPASALQVTAPALHMPAESQLFTTAVSTHLTSLGAHSVQPSPQLLPAHGW